MDDNSRIRLTRALRTALWHRRLLAAGLAAGAVALIIHAVEPRPPSTIDVVVAAHDLPGGALLDRTDLTTSQLLPETVPTGAVATIDAVAGRTLAAPMRAGEAVTDVRLIGPSLTQAWGDDLVAVPVRVSDPGVTAMVRPGDVIDLLGVPMDGGEAAHVVAAAVPLLAIPPAPEGSFTDGTLLVVAVSDDQAMTLAQAAVTSRLSVAIR